MTDSTQGSNRSSATAATAVRAVAVLTALATTACFEDVPTQPARKLPPAATLAVAPATRTAVSALLDDASGRLMPSLGDAVARAKLRGFLDDLSAALEADNSAKARRQIALARKVIAALADSPDAADLAGLGVALDQVESRLNDASALRLEP